MAVCLRTRFNLVLVCLICGVVGYLLFFLLDEPLTIVSGFKRARSHSVCNVYDFHTESNDHHECVKTNWTPSFFICIHPVIEDIYVSKDIKRDGIWEGKILRVLQNLLEQDPEMGAIDIGANIGVYTLLAAALHRPVIAVEARLLHVQMIHHSILESGLQNSDVVLLHNAISDSRKNMILTLSNRSNQGSTQVTEEDGVRREFPRSENAHVQAILMDDLLSVVNFKKAVIKMDIQGSEHLAISQCERLLKTVYVPFIFMEWVIQREGKESQQLILSVLSRNGYSAFKINNKDPLKISMAKEWPGDILWKHRGAHF